MATRLDRFTPARRLRASAAAVSEQRSAAFALARRLRACAPAASKRRSAAALAAAPLLPLARRLRACAPAASNRRSAAALAAAPVRALARRLRACAPAASKRRSAACAAAGLALALALAVTPGGAGAHSLVRPAGAVISYLSEDATSLNDLRVRVVGGNVEFLDRTVDGGMDPGSCRPGEITNDANSWIIQTFCPVAGVTALRIDLREREDKATIDVPFRATVLGGTGADTLTTAGGPDILDGGDGNDVLSSAAGNDQLTGGLGADRLQAGDGDDQVDARDGQRDTIACGPGSDRVQADQLDDPAEDCEVVTRTTVVPPPDAGDGGPDAVAPKIDVGASTLQRLRGGRTVKVMATSSERGTIAASGFVDVAGLSLPLRTVRERVAVAGAGVELRVRFTTSQMTEIRRAHRRARRVVVRLGVVATDAAGNSAKRDAPRIVLRR
jgi:hypothetical protein